MKFISIKSCLQVAIITCGVMGVTGGVYAQQKNSDPTPRTFMTPQSASKVRVYEAKQRRQFGLDTERLVQTSTQVGASGSAKSCNTTIGPSGGIGTQQQGNSGRYGSAASQRDSTVIVTGDVINVCK